MHPPLSLTSSSVLLLVLSVAPGCKQQPDGPTQPTTRTADAGGSHPPKGSSPAPKWAPGDEARGYLHQPSGVGFIYPEGWERLPLKSQGAITHLGLRNGKGAIEVTLYWTALEPGEDPTQVGATEFETLRQLYGEKVSKPEPITIAGQPGQKLSITAGPLGVNDPNLSGVVYVFGVGTAQRGWKIKVRATVRGAENLAAVQSLLQNYRLR